MRLPFKFARLRLGGVIGEGALEQQDHEATRVSIVTYYSQIVSINRIRKKSSSIREKSNFETIDYYSRIVSSNRNFDRDKNQVIVKTLPATKRA